MTTNVYRRYRTGDRGTFVIVGFAFMVIGELCVLFGSVIVLWLLSLTGVVLGLAVFVIGALAFAMGWRQVLVLPYEIHLTYDRTIEVIRVLGRSRIRADAIWLIDKVLGTIGIEGQDARRLHILHSGGSLTMPHFHQVEGFIADLGPLNPRIEILD